MASALLSRFLPNCLKQWHQRGCEHPVLEDPPKYQHADIEADREIRLFTFEPSYGATDVITIRMETFRTNDLPDYFCLSYTWGDPDIRSPIYCDGQEISVTANLWNALLYIRAKFETRWTCGKRKIYLWADQITIHQDNPDEKRSQMRLMFKLYSQAKWVICWLGEADEYTHLAFAALRKWKKAGKDEALRQRLNIAWSAPGFSGSGDMALLTAKKENSAEEEWIAQEKPMAEKRHTAEKKGPTALFSRPWFERAWTLQEIYVDNERSPMVLCGMHELPWESMVSGFLCLWTTLSVNRATEALGEAVVHASNMFAIYTRRKGNRSRLDVQLSDLLRETMRRKATEPEDRIFALLGIMEHEGITYPSRLLGIESGLQTFTMFTRIMIAQDGDLHALSVVGPPAKNSDRADDRDTLSAVGPRTESTDRLSCASSPSKSSDRPSWAMSPTGFDNLPAPLLAGGIQSSSEKRGATGKTRAMMLRSVPNSEKPASDSDKELRLRGMRRGQIIRLVNLHESWQRIPSSPHSWCGLMGRLERLVGELMLPGTQGASRKAVLLGVVAKMLVRELFTLGRPGDRRDVGSTDVAATGLYYRFKASGSSGAALKGSVDAKKDAEILYEMAMKAFRFETAEASAHRLSLCSGIMGTELISWLDVTLSQDLAREVDFTCRNMNMAVTANGQVALVYPGVQVGDEVVLLMGGFLPFILRPTVPSWQLETEQRWQLLGEANLEGCLDGKTADRCEELCKVEAQGSSPQELEIFCLT